VKNLLSPEQFICRAVGIPWVRWRSDWAACDCFGLIVLWFREVFGVDLGDVPHTDVATGFAASAGWSECGPEAWATCWMSWRDGAPTHCGVLLKGGAVLHSEGNPERPGNVRVSRLATVRRLYGEIRFYRYSAC
jgi:cell wall-associated NlpC family hydrolase